MSDGLRVRRNIDSLTSELADYIYAFQKLKEPGRPYYDSYDYFQALHDRMGKKPGEGSASTGTKPSCLGTAHTCSPSRRPFARPIRQERPMLPCPIGIGPSFQPGTDTRRFLKTRNLLSLPMGALPTK